MNDHSPSSILVTVFVSLSQIAMQEELRRTEYFVLSSSWSSHVEGWNVATRRPLVSDSNWSFKYHACYRKVILISKSRVKKYSQFVWYCTVNGEKGVVSADDLLLVCPNYKNWFGSSREFGSKDSGRHRMDGKHSQTSGSEDAKINIASLSLLRERQVSRYDMIAEPMLYPF